MSLGMLADEVASLTARQLSNDMLPHRVLLMYVNNRLSLSSPVFLACTFMLSCDWSHGPGHDIVIDKHASPTRTPTPLRA
jgi:hypothetical protein